MDLDNKIWSEIDGGYKVPYNASIPLKQLQLANDPQVIADIFDDLWDNLHHQGDIGLASYLAVPQLVRICITKKSFDWNFVGLCVAIEHCRQTAHNPKLPAEYNDIYFGALKQLEQYLLGNFNSIQDPTTLRLTLSLLATLNGQADLGKAIATLDEDVTQAFLEQF